MSWFTNLFTSNAAKPIEAIGGVLDDLFTSDEERAAADAVMEKLKQHPAELQVGINKIEAGHRSVFVAGWRPSIGWVCALSLFFFYVPQFVMAAYVWIDAVNVAILHAKETQTAIILPGYPVNADGVLELVLAMLGMAAIRTGEKLAGKTK